MVRRNGLDFSYDEDVKDMVKKPSEYPRKARISIAIDRETLNWIDEMIRKGVFANRSHSIHRALVELKEKVDE